MRYIRMSVGKCVYLCSLFLRVVKQYDEVTVKIQLYKIYSSIDTGILFFFTSHTLHRQPDFLLCRTTDKRRNN
jgi:hypothetical protein